MLIRSRLTASIVLVGGTFLPMGCHSTSASRPWETAAAPAVEPEPIPTADLMTRPALFETYSNRETRCVQAGGQRPYDVRTLGRFGPTRPQPEEVFAFSERSVGWGGPLRTIEVAIRDGSAELRWYDERNYSEFRSDRYFWRALTVDELLELRAFVRDRGIDTLADNEVFAADGTDYVYLHATPRAARRLVINNPDERNGTYVELVRLFERLADPGKLAVRHSLDELPDGAELLYARADETLHQVWAAGDDVRVLVGRAYEAPKWRSFKGGTLGDDTAAPEGWTYDPEPEPTLMPDGETRISEPVTTPDRRWIVGRVDDALVRYDSASRRRLPVAPKIFSELGHSLEFLPTHGKLLVVRHAADRWGSTRSSFGLLDVASGDVEGVEVPDAEPFQTAHVRRFQPTARPDEVWTANSTLSPGSWLCRFDLRTFKVRTRSWLPALRVDSDKVWVDERSSRAYVVFDKMLFRFPLPADLRQVRDDRPPSVPTAP